MRIPPEACKIKPKEDKKVIWREGEKYIGILKYLRFNGRHRWVYLARDNKGKPFFEVAKKEKRGRRWK